MTQVLFTLTSARSGTVYLRHLFRNNVRNCVTRHEPFFDWGNPTLFGRAIYDAWSGDRARIRDLLEKKKRYISRLGAGAYLESSHAFLKSAHLAALDVFPELGLIHLVRNPLRVAKSEAFRETWRRRIHAPFHYYRAPDGRRHFGWALTGREPIYEFFEPARLSLFQFYLVQWIEIENRAMRFLDEHKLHERCFRLHTPRDLNDADRIQALFKFFRLEQRHPSVVLEGRRNANLAGPPPIMAEDEDQFDEVITKLPDRFLEIFRRAPYAAYDWSARLKRSAAPPAPHPAEQTAGKAKAKG